MMTSPRLKLRPPWKAISVAEVLDVVEELRRTCHTARLDHLADDSTERLLGDNLVDISDLTGNVLIEKYASYGSVLAKMAHSVAFAVYIVHHNRDRAWK